MDINGGDKNRVFLHDLIKITEGTVSEGTIFMHIQIWIVNYYIKCLSDNLSNENKNNVLNHQQIPLLKALTAIPYRESTGFLQGIPCVVFPPLHALAVYRV